MKTNLCLALVVITSMAAGDGASAKGCNAGHCVHVVPGSHHSDFQALYQLRDSSFTGFVVVKQDTLHGRLSGFNRYELRLNDGKTTRRIFYTRIDYMQLNESG